MSMEGTTEIATTTTGTESSASRFPGNGTVILSPALAPLSVAPPVEGTKRGVSLSLDIGVGVTGGDVDTMM